MTTLFASILHGCGLSHSDAAEFLGVRLDTVKSWSAGRNRVPAGAMAQLRGLAAKQESAADGIVKSVDEARRAAGGGDPETIEIALPSAAEIRRRGWPSTGAFMAVVRRAWERMERDTKLSLVPAGSTETVRAAERVRKMAEG